MRYIVDFLLSALFNFQLIVSLTRLDIDSTQFFFFIRLISPGFYFD